MKYWNVKINKATAFLGGIFTGIIITIIVLVVILSKQMFTVYESKFGFNETVNFILKSVKDHKWSMPHSYDLQATLKKHGFEVQPVKVLSLCKPEHAYKILSSNKERIASALMPCRIAVYEKEGTTYVSMLNSDLFSKFIGHKVSNVMVEASGENKQILAPVIK